MTPESVARRRRWTEPQRMARMELRFWPQVRRGEPDDCWEWTGKRNPKGYGYFDARVWHFAHRFALAIDGRPLPVGMVARHSCDNPPCVNPAHLLVGTNAENVQDRMDRGRHGNGAIRHPLTACVNGHPYPESRGKTQCRICHRDRERARKAKLRGSR